MITTRAILDALKTRLAGLLLDGGPDKLFEHVEFYDTTDLGNAYRDLAKLHKSRVCLIVPFGDMFSNRQKGMRLTTIPTRRFALLIGDKDARTGQTAAFGDGTDTGPGTIGMKDLVVEDLTGQTLDLNGVLLQPSDGDVVDIEVQEQGEVPRNRKAWIQFFNTPAGHIKTTLPRGAINQ